MLLVVVVVFFSLAIILDCVGVVYATPGNKGVVFSPNTTLSSPNSADDVIAAAVAVAGIGVGVVVLYATPGNKGVVFSPNTTLSSPNSADDVIAAAVAVAGIGVGVVVLYATPGNKGVVFLPNTTLSSPNTADEIIAAAGAAAGIGVAAFLLLLVVLLLRTFVRKGLIVLCCTITRTSTVPLRMGSIQRHFPRCFFVAWEEEEEETTVDAVVNEDGNGKFFVFGLIFSSSILLSL